MTLLRAEETVDCQRQGWKQAGQQSSLGMLGLFQQETQQGGSGNGEKRVAARSIQEGDMSAPTVWAGGLGNRLESRTASKFFPGSISIN